MPDKIEVLAVLLENIYWNGFEHRGTSYRIQRSKMRDFAQARRLEAGTMKKVIEGVRGAGFLLHPVDTGDYARADLWAFDTVENQTKLPLVDAAVIRHAEERSRDIV